MYLLNKEFLRQLDLQQHKEVYAKIILLTFDEQPIKEIQGRITSGSINIDGASAVRRSCSLTMVADTADTSDVDWVLRNKFKLEVGVKNTINSKYPEIIWFKQGMYVFTSISTSVSTNNFTISLQAKDKMCLLNGELGGSLTSPTNFGKLDEEKVLDTGEIIIETKYLKIYDIIINMLHVFANEPYSNIVINDLDEQGLELLEWRGDVDLYLEINAEFGDVIQYYLKFQDRWETEGGIKFYDLYSPIADNTGATKFDIINDDGTLSYYYVARIKYGETVGYRNTELTFPGDLVGNAGEVLTSILDKIKNTFTDFEYFYDIDGRFIFQKKRTYVNTAGNGIVNTGDGDSYIKATMQNSTITYSFEDNMLITAISSQPNITNIKNDYSVFGTRQSTSGEGISIHLRTAIDIKPNNYTSYSCEEVEGIQEKIEARKYSTDPYYVEDEKIVQIDWREIIYQMAIDYYKNNLKEDFYNKIYENNKDKGYYEGQEIIPFGKTGYEQYYVDLQGFWRQLYHPGVFDVNYIAESDKKKIIRELMIEHGYLAAEITADSVENAKSNDSFISKNEKLESGEFRIIELNYQDYLLRTYNDDGWNKNKNTNPELLNFWFDFLDSESNLGKYSANQIGRREKVTNNSNIKAIAYKETPKAVFVNSTSEIVSSGYVKINLTNELQNFFSISAQGLSTFDEFYSLLYNHAIKNEQITLTALPIYYLEPNVRIHVYDKKTKINGDYIVNRITIPLQYNGTTSITATKVVDRIY